MKKQGPHYRVTFRRRREGRTDYRARARLLRSGLPRAVVRKTLNQTVVQIIQADATGDRVLASAVSNDLREQGWSVGTGNLPAAYLTGFLAGKRAFAKGVTSAVLDLGLQKPSKGGRVFAALQDQAYLSRLVDHVGRHGGVRVFVDPKSLTFVRGSRLDYAEDLLGGGFKVVNPNAKSACSCGVSFSV